MDLSFLHVLLLPKPLGHYIIHVSVNALTQVVVKLFFTDVRSRETNKGLAEEGAYHLKVTLTKVCLFMRVHVCIIYV